MRLTRPPLAMPAIALVAAMAITLACPSAWAHGGEDHGDTPAAITSPATPQAPRATAQTDSFELVAVLQPGATPTLMLYLDHADTNAPVAGASIELESGVFKGTAKAVEPGIYTLPGQAFAKPGHYPLTITVQSADSADLLDATLRVEAPPDHATEHAPTASSRWPWLAGVAGLLIATTTAWQLQRRARTNARQERT